MASVPHELCGGKSTLSMGVFARRRWSWIGTFPRRELEISSWENQFRLIASSSRRNLHGKTRCEVWIG